MKSTLTATIYLTSKWLVLIRPLVAGFDRPLTYDSLGEGVREVHCFVVDATPQTRSRSKQLALKSNSANHRTQVVAFELCRRVAAQEQRLGSNAALSGLGVQYDLIPGAFPRAVSLTAFQAVTRFPSASPRKPFVRDLECPRAK